MNEERIVSTVVGLRLDATTPEVVLDTHGPLRIAATPDADEERDLQIAAYARGLRVGDTVRWGFDDQQKDQIGWMSHPRPTIDRITLEWLRRAGADLSQVAADGAARATIWHPEIPCDWFQRFGEDDGVNLAQRLGEVRLSQLTRHPACIELRGPYLIVDADFLPETVKTAMVGDAFAGARLGDLIEGVVEDCGLTGDEIIRSITIREDGDFHDTAVNLVTGEPVTLADLA